MEHNYVHNLHIVTHFFPVPATELTFWTEVHEPAKPEILSLWLFTEKLDSARLRSPSFHLLGAGPTFPEYTASRMFLEQNQGSVSSHSGGDDVLLRHLIGNIIIANLFLQWCSASASPPRFFCILLAEWPFQNVLISMLYFCLALPHLSNKGQTQSTAPCSLPT